jgi:hypothetical protein
VISRKKQLVESAHFIGCLEVDQVAVYTRNRLRQEVLPIASQLLLYL